MFKIPDLPLILVINDDLDHGLIIANASVYFRSEVSGEYFEDVKSYDYVLYVEECGTGTQLKVPIKEFAFECTAGHEIIYIYTSHLVQNTFVIII